MPDGNDAQIRLIAESVVKAAIIEVRADENMREKIELTPGVKWLLGIASALVIAFCIWSVNTLNDVQKSVVEIKVQLGQSGAIETRFNEMDRRISKLEAANEKAAHK